MLSQFALRLVTRSRRELQLSHFKRVRYKLFPFGLQRAHVNGQARVNGSLLVGGGRPKLLRERQQVIQSGLRTLRRDLGAITKADQPVMGVAQVVAGFL